MAESGGIRIQSDGEEIPISLLEGFPQVPQDPTGSGPDMLVSYKVSVSLSRIRSGVQRIHMRSGSFTWSLYSSTGLVYGCAGVV